MGKMGRPLICTPESLLMYMQKHKGNKKKAAEDLGVSYSEFQLALKRYPEVLQALIKDPCIIGPRIPTQRKTINSILDEIQWINDIIEKMHMFVDMLVLCERRCANSVEICNAGLCKLPAKCSHNSQRDVLRFAEATLREMEELRSRMVGRPETEVLDAITIKKESGGRDRVSATAA